jgi:hypothetical protein
METLDTLRAAEDEYTRAYINRTYEGDDRLIPLLAEMNRIRIDLGMDELWNTIASLVVRQPSTSGRPHWNLTYNLDRLRNSAYAPINSSANDTIDDDKVILNDECGICLDPFTQTSIICSPNVCQHGFHCRCIRQARNKKCPLCRQPYTHLVISSYNLKPGSSFGLRRRRGRGSLDADIKYLTGL